MATEGNAAQFLCSWLIFAILFAVYLRWGLKSALVHHEGTLVSASRTSCRSDGQSACQYYVNERFLYANSTRHCTVTRVHGFYKKSIANHAVKKVVLGTTRTIYLKPGSPHTCFDDQIVHNNFVASMVMLSFAILPCCLCCCLFGCAFASSERNRSAADTAGAVTRVPNKHTPVPTTAELGHGGGGDDDGGVEMVNAVASNTDPDLNSPSNRDLVSAEQIGVEVL